MRRAQKTDEPIVVPAPRDQSIANPTPTALSPPPTFGAWGTPTLVQRVEKPKEEVTVSAAGFVGMLETEYRSEVEEKVGSDLPFGLFYYSMTMAWWRRVLEDKRVNFPLTETESEVLTSLQRQPNHRVTPKIADYLAQLGSFSTPDVEFLFNVEDLDFNGRSEYLKIRGFSSTLLGVKLDGETMWQYAHRPVPGVAQVGVWRDLGPAPGKSFGKVNFLRDILPDISVIPGSTGVEATASFLGWNPNHDGEAKISVGTNRRSAELIDENGRWKCYHDCVTPWLVSPSLIDYVDGTLDYHGSSLVEFFSSSVPLSGTSLQLSFLCVDTTSAPLDEDEDETLPSHPLLRVPLVMKSIPITRGIDLSIAAGCGFGVSFVDLSVKETPVPFAPIVGRKNGEVIQPPLDIYLNADQARGVFSIPGMRFFLNHCTGIDNRYDVLTRTGLG